MTKLESIEHKIFASEAPLDEIGQFGSALDTTKLNTKDVTTIQALPAYTKGWGSAIISDNNYPTMEEMNGVLNVMSYHTGYLYQEGIPAWRDDREYSATSIVKEPTGTKLFHSLKDGNIGKPLSNTEYWEELKLGGGGLEICDIGMALYVDETKGLRRYLNGQIVDINTNTQAFLNRLLQIQATNPEYFTTEDNWQAEATLNADGCVYKFVLNYSGDNVVSVRLPKYPDYVEVSAGNTVTTAPIKELGLVPRQGYGVNESGMYWIPAKLTNVGSTDKVNASCKLLSQDGSGAVWLSEIKSGAKGNYFSGYADLSGLKTTKLKMRYFIQIATGSETENNIINEIELNNPYSFGDSKYSSKPLNNLSWLKSEGQWNSKTTYPAYYDWALINLNNGVEGFASSNGEYTDYDIVINSAEETFRLPLLDGSEDLPSDRYIDLTLEASGSPYTASANGWFLVRKVSTGTQVIYFTDTTNGMTSSCYSSTSGQYLDSIIQVVKGQSVVCEYTTGGTTQFFRFIYAQGNGSLYYYVGETAQNANLIDAGRIGEQVANCITRNDCKAYITETYVNGTSGYIVYSNGYCEQWGEVPSGNDVDYTGTLLKSYSNTNYQVGFTTLANNTSTYATQWRFMAIYPITNSTFGCKAMSFNRGWRAYGYLAQGEY